MTCYIQPIKNGGRMFLCGDFGPHCAAGCGAASDVLCDYPVGEGKTCDMSQCERCAPEVAPGINYCAGHLAMWTAYRESAGDQRELTNVVPFKGAIPPPQSAPVDGGGAV